MPFVTRNRALTVPKPCLLHPGFVPRENEPTVPQPFLDRACSPSFSCLDRALIDPVEDANPNDRSSSGDLVGFVLQETPGTHESPLSSTFRNPPVLTRALQLVAG